MNEACSGWMVRRTFVADDAYTASQDRRAGRRVNSVRDSVLRRRRRASLVAVVCLSLVGVGCSSGEEDPLLAEIEREAAAEETADQGDLLDAVNGVPARAVPLNEWRIGIPSVLGPGPVALVLRNLGAQEHELAIFRTTVELADIPVDAKGTLIEADSRLQLIARESSVATGSTKTLTVDLLAGRYLFACNLEDHYRSGMYRYVLVV